MKSIAAPLGLILLAGLLAGCSSLYNGQDPDGSLAEVVEPQIHQVYPIKEGIDIKVSFENQKTYDAVQLGLFMLSNTERRDPVVLIEDEAFFPEYFAMINVNIEDGLLFVSEKEAVNFARVSYLRYQNSVTTDDDLRYFRKPHTLTDVITKK